MRLVSCMIFPSAAVLLLARSSQCYTVGPHRLAQTTNPPTSTISSSSGPLAWDCAPVRRHSHQRWDSRRSAAGMCDDPDLKSFCPSGRTFYQTNTAQVHHSIHGPRRLPADWTSRHQSKWRGPRSGAIP